MINLSLPQADHNPSMKFNSPDKVTSLPFFFLSSNSSSTFFSIGSFLSPLLLSSFFFSFLCPVRSSEQSMSSITIIDLLDVSISSFLKSVLSFTDVNSRS
ncbi:hypothetical protein HanPSC8_Chr03g0122081 [Helianthus annuus]|nr:hypothetical protein HanPSC8_Chr03g0122081 [Helianthus annuus]